MSTIEKWICRAGKKIDERNFREAFELMCEARRGLRAPKRVAAEHEGEGQAVGASRDDDDGLRSGSAYVYRFEVDRWVEAHKLTASDATTGDQFGISTAADDDRIAVGAYQAGPGDDASGAAYVFEL